MEVIEKIKTFDDVKKVLGIKKIKFGKVGRPKKITKTYKHLELILQAINKEIK